MAEYVNNKKDWEENELKNWLRDNPERKKHFRTKSGIILDRVYVPEETDKKYLEKIGFPGKFPFTRGISPTMYRSDFWVMGQYSGYGSAEDTNKRFRYLIDQGQTGFSIAMDLPTQIGLDSDDVLSEGEVGRVGVAIDSLKDIENLFEGIPFEKVKQLRTTANAIGPIAAALFIAYAQKNGKNPSDIKVFLQNDILKEYIARGTYIFPPECSVRLAADVIEYSAENLPTWTPIAISGYHIRESGSTAVQELAYTFCNAISYIDEVVARGVKIDKFVSNIFLFLATDIDLLEEVAKFRAARRIWARIIKDRYNEKNYDAMKLKIFVFSSGGSLTAQQPLNNICRVTLATISAALGGVQTIATSSYDEALGLPTEEAVTIALRTQQIIAYESGITNTVDPLGGSYAIEKLTNDIEEKVLEEINKIEKLGGTIKCISEGILQKEINKSAYEYQKQIEKRDRIIVGLNEFITEKNTNIEIFEYDENVEKNQKEKLKKLRNERDKNLVNNALLNIEKDALSNKNIMKSTINAVKVYATVGEICSVLRKVYGEYKEKSWI